MLPDDKRAQLDGIVQQMNTNGESDANIQAVVDDFKTKYSLANSSTPNQQAQSPSLGQTYLNTLQSAKDKITSSIDQGSNLIQEGQNVIQNPNSTFGEKLAAQGKGVLGAGIGMLGATAGATRAIFAPLTTPVEYGINKLLSSQNTQNTQNIPTELQGYTGTGTTTPQDQQIASAQGGNLLQDVNQFSQNNPNASSLIGSGVETALNSVGMEGAPVVGQGAKTLLKDTANATKDVVGNITNPTEESVNNYITQTFDKAVKPSITNKSSIAKASNYQDSVVNAVKSIADNKDNLTFNTDGVSETGRLPQSLDEFSQAIDQTKSKIYDEYSKLSQQAGDMGGNVDLAKIATNLDGVIDSKVLNIKNPEIVKYAQGLKDRFLSNGTLDVKTAEQLVQSYNDDLKAFYRNPSYDSASRAVIDAGVVNSLRKELDEMIQNLTGEQYQSLKNKYGALKTIENDVIKRANVDARKNMRGLLDYSDIFTGGQMVHGLLTLNPAQFATGAFERGMKAYFKYLNDPNRAIEKLFQKVDNFNSTVIKKQAGSQKLLPSKRGESIKGTAKKLNNLINLPSGSNNNTPQSTQTRTK